MSDQKLNVFQMDDCDWWIGESADACIDDRNETYGPDEDFKKQDVYPLSDKQMRTLTYTDEDGEKRSFKEQFDLEVKRGGRFPRLFATTEF